MAARVRLLGRVCLAACLTACATDVEPIPPGDEDAPPGAADDTGTPGATDFGMGAPGSGAPPRPTSPPSSLPQAECLSDTQAAEQVQVDMIIMLDRSGSMLDVTGAGPTKWDAIRDALTTFVADPRSGGLGVGLQYFPLQTPGVPEECFDDATCGMLGGPCLRKGCTPRFANEPGFQLQACLDAGDCPLLSECVDLGTCENDDRLLCFGPGPGGCQAMGDCVALPGACLFYASCDVAMYAEPAVPIGVLPGNGAALTDSLASEMPFGLTPTSSALAGAINHAAAYGRDHRDHRVIAVLATDGLPTDCLPVEISEVAALAAQGQQLDTSVQTYVIGVFGSEDTGARENLNELARAGGSDAALLVDPGADVAAQFVEALDNIRGGVLLQCEYQLPAPPEGVSLDFGRVNVTLTEPDQVYDLLYVGSPDNCDQAPMAWYYDIAPQDGTPTKIEACDSTCDTLRASTAGTLHIRLGCETLRPD